MKFKKVLLPVIFVTLTAVITACSNGDDYTTNETRNRFPLADMSEYNIEDTHRFFWVTMYEALALREDATFDGIIYFGFPSCPWCQSAIPVMHQISQETGTDIFYVSRAREIRDELFEVHDSKMALWLNDQIELSWLYDEDGKPLRPNITVPQIIHLRGGVVVDSHRGTFEGHNQIESEGYELILPELTALEYTELADIYTRIFSAVSSDDGCEIITIEEDGCS